MGWATRAMKWHREAQSFIIRKATRDGKRGCGVVRVWGIARPSTEPFTSSLALNRWQRTLCAMRSRCVSLCRNMLQALSATRSTPPHAKKRALPILTLA